MTQAIEPVQVSPQFLASIPAAPPVSSQVAGLNALVTTPETRTQLICQNLLVGDTRLRAQAEAEEVLSKILANTQVLAVFGLDALRAVNDLNDRMLRERPPIDIPELHDAMRNLSRKMRAVGKKYDPSDPEVLKRYEGSKQGLLSWLHRGRSFFDEFMDDVRLLQKEFDEIIKQLHGKQYLLLRNLAYYDEFYRLNEVEIDRLIYKIGVMEIVRDMLAARARSITVGDANLGDRGAEQQAQLGELATFLENKITAFKGRLWVTWAMAPQIRTMRAIVFGFSARIDQTIEITIPTMKNTIVVWQTLSEAEQAARFNQAVEETYNEVMQLFAAATKATVPMLANALASTALSPKTVRVWSDSLSAQADAVIAALDLNTTNREALEQAMIEGKQVIDSSTQRVNEALLEHLLAAAPQQALEVAHSVPAQA